MEIRDILCPHCGAKLKAIEGAKIITCKYCQSDFEVLKEESKKQVQETIFYNKYGIYVSNTRVVISDKIYSTANITAVSKGKILPSYKLPTFLTVGGIFLLLASLAQLLDWDIEMVPVSIFLSIISLIGIFIGFYIFRKRKIVYSVILESTSGRINAYYSQNEALVNDTIYATSLAIRHRG
jgi:DNA-directed RNA polymerase subunit RPC12/RpoP